MDESKKLSGRDWNWQSSRQSVAKHWIHLAYDTIQANDKSSMIFYVRENYAASGMVLVADILAPVLDDLRRQIEELDTGDFLLQREDVLKIIDNGSIND